MHEEALQEEEKIKLKNSEFGIKFQKIKYFLLFGGLSLAIFPLLFQLAK